VIRLETDIYSCIEPVIFYSIDRLVEDVCSFLRKMGIASKIVYVYRVFSYAVRYDEEVELKDWDLKNVDGCSGVKKALLNKFKRPLLVVVVVNPFPSSVYYTFIVLDKDFVSLNLVGKIISYLSGNISLYYERCLKKFI
jgi:hypothetical protein